MSVFVTAGLQALLTMPLDGAPVRFGVPLPAAAVANGLGLEGRGVLQWRRLPIGGAAADPVWVEIAVVGGHGRVAVVGAGGREDADGRGAAFVRSVSEQALSHGRCLTTTWAWCDGTTDERVRTVFASPMEIADEVYTAGEARTVDHGDLVGRAAVLARLPRRVFTGAGLLPPDGRVGAAVRKQIAAVVHRLPELPGARGAGDFVRSGGVVTNLEFDTTLAAVRCATALADREALALAARCARHLVDHDVDARTGLPFPHGLDHRSGVPEPGHVWLQGLLWVGLLLADDELLAAARGMARALAACPPRGEGQRERARDHAWPLRELEALLAIDPDPVLAAAADRLAIGIDARYDPGARTYRFGEGEAGDGIWFERAWVTGGVVLPALRAHLRRRPDARIAAHVGAVQQALLDQIDRAQPGLPTHWRCAGRRTFAEHRAVGDPQGVLMLDGFEAADVRRLLRREVLRDAVAEVLMPDDPDLATAFTMVARSEWVWR